MGKTNFIIAQVKKVCAFGSGLLACILVLYGCAQQKPQLSASLYRFNFNDEAYRLRSISSGNKVQAFNELIGENFLAADFDQDGILDRILLGAGSLSDAQKIYEYGLEAVTKENKLQVRIPRINRYVHESNDFQTEIRSFRPTEAQPFNEFIVIDHRPVVHPEILVIVDQNADGTLDEVLKGSTALEKAQSQYAQAIAAGLQKGELIKANGMILVKGK